MTARDPGLDPGLDPRLEQWLADGSTSGPESVLLGAFAATRELPQERTGLRRLLPASGSPALRTALRLALIAALVGAGVAAIALGSRMVPSPVLVLPDAYGPAGNGRIAYGRSGDIWVRDADGRNPRPLITGTAFDRGPVWSHDGTRLVFERREAAQPARVMVADADGANVRPLADVKGTDGDWTATAWSPDGRWVAVRWAVGGVPTITIIDAVGESPTFDVPRGPFEPDGQLAWLPPDGEELLFGAFDTRTERRAVHAVHPDGTGLRTIAEDPAPACPGCSFQDFAVSPDGATLAYWSWEERDGRGEAYIHVRDIGTGVDRVPPFDAEYPGMGLAPRFSPDSRWLLFEGGPHDQAGRDVLASGSSVGQLAIVPVDGSLPARPLGTWYTDHQVSDFSPDGGTVLQDRGPGGSYLIDLDDGLAVPTEEALAAPSWQRLAPP